MSNLYWPFEKKLLLFEEKLVAAKLPFYRFCGLRTFAEQAALYAKGRTAPGEIVTKARPGQSLHNYGLAADYVLDGMIDKPGIQWSWETKGMDLNNDAKNDWLQMAQIARNQPGLVSGYFWAKFPDLPHIQLELPERIKLDNLLAWYNAGGLSNVWAELDKLPEMKGI